MAAFTVAGRPRTDPAGYLQDILTAHPIGALKVLFGVGVKHHLHNALAVAQIEENDTTVIPAAINPTAEGDRFVNIQLYSKRHNNDCA